MKAKKTATKGDLVLMAKGLREFVRFGAETDNPEGVRYIVISDTLANEMAETIEAFCEERAGAE